MWEACGALGMPVAIHISDPEAFFLPIDRYNERYEELHNHPDWSFHGKDFPRFDELLAARDRVFARHPKTHVHRAARRAQRREPRRVSARARPVPEHARRDRRAHRRTGPPAARPRGSSSTSIRTASCSAPTPCPTGVETPQQIFGETLYAIYYRFLETEDEYFDYAPAQVPPQGRWRIYGVGLPDAILRKVYNENAQRLLKL